MPINKEQALKYHCTGQPGKIAIKLTKPCQTADELSLAYTPGVADPVREIASDIQNAFKYTNKGNLVAVISNGTAILGLGNLGALASKPVMEGKAVLFKRFADVDVFDIEIDTTDPQKIIEIIKLLEPTFGGINMEDIKAPECFQVEEELKKICQIPIFHDDQHGTAIVSGAALLNALEITNRQIDKIKVVVNGAGAAGIACTKFFVSLGLKKENIILLDSRGVVYKGRVEGMDKYKEEFAQDTDKRTLAEAIKGTDVFLGVSKADLLTPEMLLQMNDRPIVLAMANPDPEIKYELAKQTRADVIMATGRSDYPNQVNNVLGFPFIFRGALDVGAKQITEGMKIVAAKSLATLAKEPVPEAVKRAYNNQEFSFGPDYIIPKPFDPRVIEWETVAVAKAAVEEGIATKPISDWEQYRQQLRERVAKYWE